jgi:hypothetical protein
MARKFLVPIGLLSATSDPTGHLAGEVYFNTTSGKIKIYDGDNWVDVNTDSVNELDGGTP